MVGLGGRGARLPALIGRANCGDVACKQDRSGAGEDVGAGSWDASGILLQRITEGADRFTAISVERANEAVTPRISRFRPNFRAWLHFTASAR